ncbi:translocation/assembly module TamB domain-containing protein [Rheinheimera sp. MMS21-TC3]|uniref:autotransporter assembly complex protein TamB n=1 Tax=Rheinheimera sp. MMS21-TC3 TaxID=3072790 RepID=UPI0028C38434|nr:translocation/assembly module TamB domain-containing protein [Rheinheimera sp. MMS21-TC3]WNO61233.1 translocation/assembly module TamB domain-containing protein [Rheinheimera sp. MMS21-TC3]
MNWRRGLKWLNFTLLIPFLVIALLLYVLLFTQLGLNFSVWLAKKVVPELTIASSSGYLLGELQLKNVQWQQDEHNSLALTQLDFDLQTSCLLSGKVCINQLLVDGITLQLTTAESTTEPASNNQAIFIPIPVTVKKLAITNGNILLDGHQLNWQHFSAKVDAWGAKVQLDEVEWQQVNLTPAAADLNTSTMHTSTTEPFSYQALQLEDISLPLAIYISQFTLTDFTLHTATAQHLPFLQFAIQAQKQHINLTHLQLQHPQVTAEANLQLTLKDNYPIKAKVELVLLDEPLAQQKLRINLEGDFADLTINAIATNNIQAQLDAKIALLTDNLPITAKLTAAAPNIINLDDQTKLTIKATKLNITGDLQQLQLLANTDYKLTNIPAGNLALTATVTPKNAQINKLIINGLAGKTELTAKVDWQQDLQWHSQIQFKKIDLGILLQDYPGRISGQLSHQGKLTAQGNWLLDISTLDISGAIRDLPFTLQGDLQAQGDTSLNNNLTTPTAKQLLNSVSFNSKTLSLIHGDNSIIFSGGLAKHWQLTAAIQIPDLSKSIANAKGKLNGKAIISGAKLTPTIVAAIKATDIRYQQFALDLLQLDSNIKWADSITADINLEAKQGRFQQHTLEQLTIKLQGNEQQHAADIQLLSSLGQADVELSGQLTAANIWQGKLKHATLSSIQGQWQLQQAAPIQYAISEQQVTISQHCWQQQTTRLCLDKTANISAEQGQFVLSLNQFELATLDPLLPISMTTTGKLEAKASASWQQNTAAKVTLTVKGENGSTTINDTEAINIPWQSFLLQLDSAEQLNTKLDISFTDKAKLHAMAVISDLMQTDRKVEASLNISEFSLDFLQPLFDSSSDVSAEVNSQLRFTGLLAAPELSGNFSIANIKITGKGAPTTIENGSINLTFLGETAAIEGQLDTLDGQIALTGKANWQDINDWHATMQLAGDALSLQMPNISLKVKPNLTLDITPKLTLITGVVEVPNANISIDDLPQSAVAISSDTVLLDEQGLAIERTNTAPIPIHTDIKVILSNNVKLQAFGLVTKLSGELAVRQQDKGPQIYGEVALIDGTFRSYGQDLLIRRGKLKFNGPADQPYLDIEAIRNPESTEDDVIAGIKVVGPADEPLVTIFSEPGKPQANALSYLLTGRDIGSDSGSAADALTTSLIGMSIASSSKLVGNIGAAFGINDLSLDTAGAGNNSQVTVSGHLSRDLELKYGYGIFNAIGEFTLRYRIMRRLYLESVSGLDNTVDLLYKFEFD